MQTSSSINADIQAWTGSMFESEDLNKKYFSLLTEEAKTLIHSHKLFASIFSGQNNGTRYSRCYNDIYKMYESVEKLANTVKQDSADASETVCSCYGYIFNALASALAHITSKKVITMIEKGENPRPESSISRYQHERNCRVAVRALVENDAVLEMEHILLQHIQTRKIDSIVSREMVFWQLCRHFNLFQDKKFSYRSYPYGKSTSYCWNYRSKDLSIVSINERNSEYLGQAHTGESIKVHPIGLSRIYYILNADRRTIVVGCSYNSKPKLLRAMERTFFELSGSAPV